MVPTKRFWALIAAGIPLASLAAYLHIPMAAVAYDLLLFVVAIGSAYLAPSVSRFSVKRQFDSVLSVRAANKITLILDNDGVETLSGTLRDEPPALFESTQREFEFRLEPRKSLELTYHVTPRLRGSERFNGTYVRLDCPLGLMKKDVFLSNEEPVRVYPNVLALREFDLLKQQGRLKELGIRKSRSRGLGTEFESLREYSEGDDFRKIDWKATARRGKLVVRQYEQERNQTVIICIDIGRHMMSEVNGVRKLDHVLDSLLMLTNAAAIAGDFVGLLVYGDTVRRYIPPRKGRAQLGVIIEAVHDLVAEPIESDPIGAFAYLSTRWKRRSLLVNFTDYEDPDRARDLTVAFGPMARRHLALIVRVQDPKIDEVRNMEVATVSDMYRKSAATMLMEDRKAAGSLVSAAGIHNLEAEPQDLASSLVSYYFHVKERSLL